MSRLAHFRWFVVLVLSLAALAFLAPAAVRAQSQTYAFMILGPDGPVARVIQTGQGCPAVTIDGKPTAMQTRGAPDANFPVTVCDALIPPEAKEVAIGKQALHVPKATPEKVVILGDTGCRLKGSQIQACNDPAAWPFAQVAASAAKNNPDLVIHVGDYHYREAPCDPAKANCNGSPWGDNWAAWDADLFTPARPLLEAAPWVIVPGNHEDCARAGTGYFLLLDPRPLPATCPNYTEPYAINYMEPQLIVMDDSAVNDYQVEPDQVAIFAKQFQTINGMAKNPAWLLVHDPLYVFGHLGVQDGKEQLFIDQLTLQQASNNTFPAGIQAFMSGHIHLFETLSFEQGRPPQLVVGNGGTLLDPPVTTPLTGLEMAGMKVQDGTMIDEFGYVDAHRAGDHWQLAVRGADGGLMDGCVLGGGTLKCGQNLPAAGGDFTSQPLVIILAAFGALLLLGGVFLIVRAVR